MSSSQSSDPSKPALNIDGRSIWDLDLGMSSLDLTVYASGLPGRKEPVEIGNLSQLSFSSHRDKFPVSSLGRVGMKSYVGGHRTLGGNLVFSTTDESAWSDLVYPMSRSMARQVHPDEYPPFTIIMTRVNEVGRVSYGALYGVTILDFGTNESVDNLIPMESYSMMALSMSRFTPYESPVPEILRNLGAFAESYNGLMASTVLSESNVKVVK